MVQWVSNGDIAQQTPTEEQMMDITPEMIKALVALRELAAAFTTVGEALNVFDNADVFAAIDNASGDAEERAAHEPNGLDPAEYGDMAFGTVVAQAQLREDYPSIFGPRG